MSNTPITHLKQRSASRSGLRWFFGALLASSFAWSAHASSHSDEAINFQAMGWASSCVTCHGAGPDPVPGQTISNIAGMPVDEFIEQMEIMHSVDRPGVLMVQIAKGYDEEIIRGIAEWYQMQGRQEND